MASKIQQLLEKYGKFDNILPEELKDVDFKELEQLKAEFSVIKDEDLAEIKKLATNSNLEINFDQFKNWDYIVKMGFLRESDDRVEDSTWYFAHWYMSLITLDMLTGSLIDVSSNLVIYYKLYINPTGTVGERKNNFNHFVRTWQDFSGYLINIRQTVYDYYSLFATTCNLIDANSEKAEYYALKSDDGPPELYAAVKELLLHGNRGRLSGFALLRSMLEIAITRNLFDLQKSNKYKEKEVVIKRNLTSIGVICQAIEKLGFAEKFKMDTIRRLYDVLSIVSHRGYRSDEYVTWFVRTIVGVLTNNFYKNIQGCRDDIIQDLVDTDKIQLMDGNEYSLSQTDTPSLQDELNAISYKITISLWT